jgi:hypothetical protein
MHSSHANIYMQTYGEGEFSPKKGKSAGLYLIRQQPLKKPEEPNRSRETS